MSLSPLATVSELGAALGRALSDDDTRAETALSRASALVRSYTGQLFNDTEGVPDDVKGVVVDVAMRRYENPNAAIQITKGPFTTRLAEAAGEGLYLTAGEKAILSKYRAGGGGLWTLRRTRGDEIPDDTGYVPTGPPPSGADFPWYGSDVRI